MQKRSQLFSGPLHFAMLIGAALVLPTMLPGCNYLAAGGKSKVIPADYRGLDNKSVAIVIYTTRANTDEFPDARKDISSFITNQMRLHLPTARLLDSEEVIRWQDDTINWYGLAVKDIGKHFSVDRVLYIELITYEARADGAYGDLQGHVRANCQVFNVNSPGDGPDWTGVIDTLWPEDNPVSANQTNEIAVRANTLQRFAKQLVGHFYDQHNADIPLQDRQSFENVNP